MQTGGLVFQNGRTFPFRYSGKYGVQTDESGLLYMRSRYYSPDLRQFLSADRYMGDLYHPASLNSYSYVEGNPVKYIDPMGYAAVHAMMMDGGSLPKQIRLEKERAIILEREKKNQRRYALEAALYGLEAKACDTVVQGYHAMREDIRYIPVFGFAFTAGEGPYTLLTGDDFYMHGKDMDSYLQDWKDRTLTSTHVSIFFLSGMIDMGYTGKEPVVGKAPRNPNSVNLNSVNPNTTSAAGETVKIYRVQGGGSGTETSRERISVKEDGTLRISRKKEMLHVSAENIEHPKYYLENRRPGGEIIEMEVPKWFYDFLKENAIKQKNYMQNPLNQGGMAPQVVDESTPGVSYGLPAPWIEWLEEYGVAVKQSTQ